MVMIAVNARFTHSNLALLYLREYCRDLEFDIRIREFTVQQSAAEIAGAVIAENADAAAFSVYIWNSRVLMDAVILLKKESPRTTVILGGPEAGYDAARWLRDTQADYVVTGRGEEGFRKLLERGISWDGPVVSVPAPHFSDIPMPYRDEDFPLLAHRYVYYESSRGCPFRCAYCLSSLEDQNLEMKDAGTVKGELSSIMRHSPHTIKFVDRTFNARGERAREIWKFIMEEFGGLSTSFHFEVHPALLEEADFGVLAAAPPGLFRFEIGIQSANEDTLREIGRSPQWDRVERSVRRLTGMGLFHVHVDLIAGLPFEDMGSMKRSFDKAHSTGPQFLQLGFLKILPGTAMAERAGEYGMKHDDDAPYRVRETGWLSGGEMELLDIISHLVNSLHNTGNFPVTMAELEARTGSPFEMYRSLAARCGRPAPGRDWEAGASLILSHARDAMPEHAPFMADCLRWDWCGARAPRRYPPMLRSGDSRAARRDFNLRALRDRTGGPAARAQTGGLLFLPETALFRDRYLRGGSMAVFNSPGSDPSIY